MFSAAGRGVQSPINEGRPANSGEPRTVIKAAKVELVIVEYFDHEGRATQGLFLKAGENYYAPKDGSDIAWVQNLRPAQEWMSRGLQAKLPLPRSEARISDHVAILPRQDAAPAESETAEAS